MQNNKIIDSTKNNDWNDSFVTIKVTGLSQNRNLRHSCCTYKVPHSSMAQTINRIKRMGGKIVDVIPYSKHHIEKDFVEPIIAVETSQNLTNKNKIETKEIENKVITTVEETPEVNETLITPENKIELQEIETEVITTAEETPEVNETLITPENLATPDIIDTQEVVIEDTNSKEKTVDKESKVTKKSSSKKSKKSSIKKSKKSSWRKKSKRK